MNFGKATDKEIQELAELMTNMRNRKPQRRPDLEFNMKDGTTANLLPCDTEPVIGEQ